MIAAVLHKLVEGHSLSGAEMREAVGAIMDGGVSGEQLAAFLVALRMKGESVDELAGAAQAMRERVTRVQAPANRPVIDTCGTGGDSRGTFNISTAAAIVAAAAGACVAKHGNRAVSSKSGSADVLEALGLHLDVPIETSARCLQEHGFAFLFAQKLHPAMKHAAGVRRELGLRTIFNLLGPLCNPAGADRQVLGVYARAWVEPMAEVLAKLGCRRALVVHGEDGLDEISLSGATAAAELHDGEIRVLTLRPEEVGLRRVPLEALAGGDAARNATIIREVFEGRPGPARDAVVLNAGAALQIAELAPDLMTGVHEAQNTIDAGKALATLESLKRTLRPPVGGAP